MKDSSRRTITGSGEVKATRHDVAVFLNDPRGYAHSGDHVPVEIVWLNGSDVPVSVKGTARVFSPVRGPEDQGDPGLREAPSHRRAWPRDPELDARPRRLLPRRLRHPRHRRSRCGRLHLRLGRWPGADAWRVPQPGHHPRRRADLLPGGPDRKAPDRHRIAGLHRPPHPRSQQPDPGEAHPHDLRPQHGSNHSAGPSRRPQRLHLRDHCPQRPALSATQELLSRRSASSPSSASAPTGRSTSPAKRPRSASPPPTGKAAPCAPSWPSLSPTPPSPTSRRRTRPTSASTTTATAAPRASAPPPRPARSSEFAIDTRRTVDYPTHQWVLPGGFGMLYPNSAHVPPYVFDEVEPIRLVGRMNRNSGRSSRTSGFVLKNRNVEMLHAYDSASGGATLRIIGLGFRLVAYENGAESIYMTAKAPNSVAGDPGPGGPGKPVSALGKRAPRPATTDWPRRLYAASSSTPPSGRPPSSPTPAATPPSK